MASSLVKVKVFVGSYGPALGSLAASGFIMAVSTVIEQVLILNTSSRSPSYV
jgi:hypothetical protein